MLPNDVDREKRPVSFISQPSRIFLSNPAAEVRAEVGHERLHGIEETAFLRFFKADMPARQFNVELGEISGSAGFFTGTRELPEASGEILRRTLIVDPSRMRVTTESTWRGLVGFTR